MSYILLMSTVLDMYIYFEYTEKNVSVIGDPFRVRVSH